MKIKSWKFYAVAMLSLFIFSCLTINVYFPAAAVQEAADDFVDDVQEGGETETSEQSFFWKKNAKWSVQLMRAAHAQGEEAIQINTPEAKRLKGNMKKSYPQIATYKGKGAIGENNKGLLAEKDLSALALPERAKAKQVIKSANADRMKLYKEIVRANNYPGDKLAEIQTIFAKSWQDKSKAGWWIQKQDGSWVKK